MGKRAAEAKIPHWVVTGFLLFVALIVAIGIFIGLHSRVFGPDW